MLQLARMGMENQKKVKIVQKKNVKRQRERMGE